MSECLNPWSDPENLEEYEIGHDWVDEAGNPCPGKKTWAEQQADHARSPVQPAVSEMARVIAVIDIALSQAEIEEGEGDLAQAVQNVIGHTGARVLDVEESTAPAQVEE